MTSKTRPSIAVIGASGLVDPLRAAGYTVLAAGATDTPTVAAAAKAEAAAGRPFVVLVGLPAWGGIDPATRAWLSVQVGAGRRVLGLVTDPADTTVEGIGGTRTVALPATVDELMASYGAPPVGGTVGMAVVGVDGTVTPVGAERPAADADADGPLGGEGPELVKADPWTDASSGFDISPTPIRAGIETSRPIGVTPVRPVVAGATALRLAPAEYDPPSIAAPPPAPASRFSEHTVGDIAVIAVEADEESWPPERLWAGEPEPACPPRLRRGPAGDAAMLEAFPTPLPSSAPGGPAAGLASTKTRLAPALVVLAGKGGVGKSSAAAAIAGRAASSGVEGFRRVVLVDANRGQGDIARFLRVAGAGLPSVYDAAISGDPAAALCLPDRVNSARPAGLGAVDFAVALAPADDQADPAVVTADVYRSVIGYARAHADLVVVDTQIVEAVDTSGLIDHLVVPLLVDGAWGLGIADQSAPGFDNLVRRLNRFSESGVNAARLMVGFNRLRPDTTVSDEALRRAVAPWAAFIGAAVNDPEVAAMLDLAQLPPPGPYRELMDAVLHRVSGLAVFAPDQCGDSRPPRRPRRWPLRRSR
jgi:Mrp family chromosome partitioning ATPase